MSIKDTHIVKPASIARGILLALVVAAPWPFGSVTPRVAGALSFALVVIALTFFGIELARRGRLPTPRGRLIVAAFLLLVALQLLPLPELVSGLFSPASGAIYAAFDAHFPPGSGWHPISVEPFETAWTLLQLVALALAYALASRLFARTEDRVALAVTTTLVGVALSLFAVYQSARFGTVIYGRFPTTSGTPFGPFVNHNHFAGYVEACALVALGAAIGLTRRSGALAALFGGAAGFMAIALVLSQSRGGLVAFGFGLAVLLVLAYDSRPAVKGSVAVGGGLVLVFLLAYAPNGTFSRWNGIGARPDNSVSYRAQLWTDSIRLAARGAVAGTGLGTYAAVIPGYRSGPDETRAEHAESDWIEMACEAGFAGIVLTLLFLFKVGRAGLAESRKALSERGRGLKLGLLAASAALVAHGFIDFNLRIPSNALLFVVMLGALAPGSTRPALADRRFPRLVVMGLLVVFSLGYGALIGSMAVSRHLAREVNPLLTNADEFASVIQKLARERQRMPYAPQTDFLIGRLYNEEAYRSAEEAAYREVRLRQAVDQFRIALAKAPARGRYWFELAWTEASRGNLEAADRLFERAFELEPHWADLRANHALYLAASGRTDEAIAELEQGLSLEPGLEAIDALTIIGPYVHHDRDALARLVGPSEEAARVVEGYLRTVRQ